MVTGPRRAARNAAAGQVAAPQVAAGQVADPGNGAAARGSRGSVGLAPPLLWRLRAAAAAVTLGLVWWGLMARPQMQVPPAAEQVAVVDIAPVDPAARATPILSQAELATSMRPVTAASAGPAREPMARPPGQAPASPMPSPETGISQPLPELPGAAAAVTGLAPPSGAVAGVPGPVAAGADPAAGAAQAGRSGPAPAPGLSPASAAMLRQQACEQLDPDRRPPDCPPQGRDARLQGDRDRLARNPDNMPARTPAEERALRAAGWRDRCEMENGQQAQVCITFGYVPPPPRTVEEICQRQGIGGNCTPAPSQEAVARARAQGPEPPADD